MKGYPEFVDTLRLSESERRRLLAELKQSDEQASGANVRSDIRTPYDVPAGLVVTLHQLGGTLGHFLVRPRNISRGGIGFLHGQFIHPGSRVQLALKSLNGRVTPLKGKVAWCRHVTGRVHEIGVQFDAAITLAAFVEGCVRTESDQQHSVELKRLQGRVLYIDDSESQRELMKYHLENLGLTVDTADSGLTGMQLFEQKKYDLIMTEYWLPGLSGAELIEMMRGTGYKKPIVALLADGAPNVHQECAEKGCTAALAKPVSLELLMDELGRLLPAESASPAAAEAAAPVYSTFWTQQPMRPLILRYLGKLQQQVHHLGEALSKGDAPQAMKLILELRASSGSYGYPDVMSAAESLHNALAGGPERDAALQHLQRSIEAACRIPELAKSA